MVWCTIFVTLQTQKEFWFFFFGANLHSSDRFIIESLKHSMVFILCLLHSKALLHSMAIYKSGMNAILQIYFAQYACCICVRIDHRNYERGLSGKKKNCLLFTTACLTCICVRMYFEAVPVDAVTHFERSKYCFSHMWRICVSVCSKKLLPLKEHIESPTKHTRLESARVTTMSQFAKFSPTFW